MQVLREGVGERVADESAVVPVGEGEGDRQKGEPARRVLRLRGGLLPGVGLPGQRQPLPEVLAARSVRCHRPMYI